MKKLIFSQKTTITKPSNRHLFPVDEIDWIRIINMLKKINFKSNWWERAAWFSAAMTIAFLIAAFGFKSQVTINPDWKIYEISFWVATGFSLLITIIFGAVAYRFSQYNKEAVDDILKEMNQLKDCGTNKK